MAFWKETKEFGKDIFVIISPKNRVKTFWIVIIVLIASVGGLRLLYKFPCHWNDFGIMVGISSYFISIVGVFISARIMMEVDRKRTKTIEDYLRMTRNIVRNSNAGDNIYVIAPTFCAGITEHKRLLENLYKNIEKKKDVNFIFAYLKTSDCITPERIDYLNDYSNIDVEKVRDAKKDDSHWEMIAPFFVPEIERKTKDYVRKETRETEIKCVIKEKIEIVNSYEKQLKNKENIEIHYLSKDFYLKMNNSDAPNVFGGFFATVNLGNLTTPSNIGQYYLGYFHHDGEKTIFKGTSFEVEGVGINMKTFLDSFLSDNKCAKS